MVALISVVAGGVFMACTRQPAPTPPVATGVRLKTRDDIKPSLPLEPEAMVTLAGTKRLMDVVASHDEESEDYEITLELHGDVYDEERYRDTTSAFSLMTAAGEEYDPPLPLLKFPMTAGDTWEWMGTSDAGLGEQEAKAFVTTSEEQAFVCGVPVNAIKTNVKVSLKREKGPPVVREMTFYFAAKRGLFKRSWENTSIREPNCK